MKAYKIYVKDQGTSRSVQEKAFRLGYLWFSGGNNVPKSYKPFLYLGEDGLISYSTDFNGIDYFLRAPGEIILWDKFLELSEPKKENEFKPFDKVLVRDESAKDWRIDMFSHRGSGAYSYACLGNVWRFCIQFEGNEHLLGTSNYPE